MAKSKLAINDAACKGCQLCVVSCPKKILELNKDSVNVKGYNPVSCTDIEQCTACAVCAKICPDSVISVYKLESDV